MEAIGNPGGCSADDSKTPMRSNLPSHDQREHRPSLYLLLLFLALTAGIVATGYFFYRHYERNFRAEVERGLSSIADLKVGQLVQWRKERMGNASVFYKNKVFSGLVRRFLEKPADVEARGLILSWLERVQGAYPCYRIFILDAQGIERLAVPEAPPAPVASHLLQQIPEVLRSDKITFLDFYRDAPDRPIHLSLAIPVREESDGGQPLGVLVLHIDPAPYLYPYISAWPTPSRTGETLIIRRDGNDALFLNELKFQKDTALKLRVPLTSTDLPAVKAALGQEGIVEGIDYRGVRVLADVRRVPDSPWFLVVCMDTAEVLAPLRARLWLMIGLVAVLLCGAGAGVGMIWRLQRVRFYRERYKGTEALRRAEENFRHSLDDAPLGVRIVSAEGETIYANRAILDIYGFSSVEELRTKPLKKRYTPESYAEFQKRYERRQQGEDSPSEYEVSIVRKNGEVRHLLVSRKELLWNGKKQYQTLYRDITERKRAEEALQQSEEKYKALIETTSTGWHILDAQDRVIDANKEYIQLTGHDELEEIIGRSVVEWTAPHDMERNAAELKKCYEQGYIRNLEIDYVNRIGQITPVEINATVMGRGDSVRIFGLCRDITERKRTEKVNAAVYKISEVTNNAENLEELFQSIHSIISELMPARNFYIALYDPETGLLSFPYFKDEYDEAPPSQPLRRGLTDYVLRQGEPLLADPVKFLELERSGEVESIGAPSIDWLGVPLKVKDKTIGVLVVQTYTEGVRYKKEDRDMLMFVSMQAAVAIERKRAETTLRASLHEKEVLLKEIHHRVKNNMQVISSLFNLQAGHTTNEECRGILKEGQTRIRSMALVHEKLYQSRDLSKIDFADYIQSLAVHLFHSYLVNPAQVRMETDFKDVSLDINSAVPCGLILNELISNALKHAFPEGRTGVIKIGLRRGPGGAVELRVADDGVGFPKRLDFRKAESFGLQIVNLLVDQLEAAIDLDRTKGTAFTMTFRELKYAPRV